MILKLYVYIDIFSSKIEINLTLKLYYKTQKLILLYRVRLIYVFQLYDVALLLYYNISAVFVDRNSLYFILQNQDGSGVICYYSVMFGWLFNCLQFNLEMCLYCVLLFFVVVFLREGAFFVFLVFWFVSIWVVFFVFVFLDLYFLFCFFVLPTNQKIWIILCSSKCQISNWTQM